MNELIAQLGRLLEAAAADPGRAIVVFILVSLAAPLYRVPMKVLLAAVGEEAAAVADYWRAPPKIELPARPWPPRDAMGLFSKSLNPIIEAPIAALTSAIEHLTGLAVGALRWPVERVTSPAVVPLQTLADRTQQAITFWQPSAARAVWHVSHELRGSRSFVVALVGSVLYAGASVVFLASDYAVGVQAHLVALNQQPIPSLLQAQAVAFTTASVAAVATLALVLADLTGISEFSPWASLPPTWLRRTRALVIALICLALLGSIALSLWRADEIMRVQHQELLPLWIAHGFLLFALAAPFVLLVSTTIFASWGVPAGLWLVCLALGLLVVIVLALARVAVGLVELLAKLLVAIAHGALRAGGLIGIAVVLVPLGLCIAVLFASAVLGVGSLAALTLLALVVWNILYFGLTAVLLAIAFFGRLSTPTVKVLEALYFVVAWPLLMVWNYFARSKVGRDFGVTPVL